MRRRHILGAWLVFGAILPSLAYGLPVQLKDGNGTRYNVNTQVSPLITDSLASGALTDATYTAPITFTNYYYFETWFGDTTTATTRYQVTVPLTPTFTGFNALFISSLDGVELPSPVVFNPGEPLAGGDCPAHGTNQQLIFPTEAFVDLDLAVTRKVYVARDKQYARWLNIVTNTGSVPHQVGIMLRGLLASGTQTKIVATSSGGTLSASTNWFTTTEIVPQGYRSLVPKVGCVVQNTGAVVPASSIGINSIGQAAITYLPTIQPGETAIVMTFVTVQGMSQRAKNNCERLVKNPPPTAAVRCMSQQELTQVVNFPPLTAPTLRSARVHLDFRTAGRDTVDWKGNVTIGAGIPLEGLPVTVDFGGVSTRFVLDKKGSANNGGGNALALHARLQKGVTKAGNVPFSFRLKGNYRDALAAYGLVDQTVSDVAVTIPLDVSIGPSGSYEVRQPFTYEATEGASGTAKAS